MDFQSRINQFRQGLKDQQDSYNSLAQSSAQYGRSIIPDKVAQHLTYMEQVGGMITGASAGLHGAINMGKKIQKFRQARQQKNNPTGQKAETQQGDQGSKSSRQGQQELNEREAQQQTEETKPIDRGGELTAKGKPSEPFDIGESGGIPRPKAGEEEEDDDELDLDTLATERQTERQAVKQGKQPATQPDDESDLFQEQSMKGQLRGDTATRVEQGEGAVSEDPFANVDFSARPLDTGSSGIGGPADNLRITNTGGTGGNVAPKSDAPTKPSGTAEGDAPNVESTLADNTESSGSLVDTLSEGASKFTGAVSDAVNVAKAGVKDAVTSVVGEVGGEAIASTVPVLGELFGLGMLIRSVIEHHKHEENAPPPKLTAPNPEATEQSGGFSDAMLKGSVQAPSIV